MVSDLIKSFYGKLMAQCHINIDQAKHAIIIFLEDSDNYSELDSKSKKYLESLRGECYEYYEQNKKDFDDKKFKEDILLRLKRLEDERN